jgi:NitT/TauT family transport system ATP-binding protein
MPTDGAPVLELRGVRKEFQQGKRKPFVAVTDLNATVLDLAGAGEFICIVGPSGCGKSTLLQLVAGFETHLPPTAGELRFRGQPITGPSAERGMLFQDYSCYPHLTVLDNIAFGLRLHASQLGLSQREIASISREWLRKVRLADGDAPKYPHELSGGMRQRVALARCLALKPRCVLMDEPFSALDEPTRFGMQDLIAELWADIDATILLVSHSVAEAVYLGDRVWLMSPAPGTLVAEFSRTPMPTPGIPAMVAQSSPEFAECVAEVSRAFLHVLKSRREDLQPIHADGNGQGLALEGHG